jgi:hypothetical protein
MTGQPAPEPAGTQMHRLCVFDLCLNCGHIATVAVDGWYPVSVACCNRLGGTILRGSYVPYASQVDYVRALSERYEYQPAGTPRAPDRLLGRRPRTDQPYQPSHRWAEPTAGRYPARVGAAWSIDGSRATAVVTPLTHP